MEAREKELEDSFRHRKTEDDRHQQQRDKRFSELEKELLERLEAVGEREACVREREEAVRRREGKVVEVERLACQTHSLLTQCVEEEADRKSAEHQEVRESHQCFPLRVRIKQGLAW